MTGGGREHIRSGVQKMDKQYYLDCPDRGTKLYWHTLSKARGMSLHTGAIEWVMSVPRGGVERIFNINLPDGRANELLDELVDMIKKNEAPYGILITPSSKPDNIDEILSAKGFHVDYDTGSGMAMDISPSINKEKPDDNISIVRVKDLDTLRIWTDIVSTALFEDNLFSIEQFYDLLLLDNTYFYLGLLNGQPASTCMTIAEGDIATVEMVSTLKEYRKNGLATAVAAKALQELPGIGVKTAILCAEKEAVNVYKRVGFKEFYKRIIASCECE